MRTLSGPLSGVQGGAPGGGQPPRQGPTLPVPCREKAGFERGGKGGVLLHLPALRFLRGQLPQRRARRPSLFRRPLEGQAEIRDRLAKEDHVPGSGQQVADVQVGGAGRLGASKLRRTLDRIQNQGGRSFGGSHSAVQQKGLFGDGSRGCVPQIGKGEGEGSLFPRLCHELRLRRHRQCGGRRALQDGRRGHRSQGPGMLRPSDLSVGRPGNLGVHHQRDPEAICAR